MLRTGTSSLKHVMCVTRVGGVLADRHRSIDISMRSYLQNISHIFSRNLVGTWLEKVISTSRYTIGSHGDPTHHTTPPRCGYAHTHTLPHLQLGAALLMDHQHGATMSYITSLVLVVGSVINLALYTINHVI